MRFIDCLKLLFSKKKFIQLPSKRNGIVIPDSLKVGFDNIFIGDGVIETNDRTKEELLTVLHGTEAAVIVIVAEFGSDLSGVVQELMRLAKDTRVVEVSFDKIYAVLSGTFKRKLRRIYLRVESEAIKTALENNVNVIVSRYSGSSFSRERILNIAKRYGAKTIAVRVFNSPKRKIPNNVLSIVSKSFSEPTTEEGFDEVVLFEKEKGGKNL